MSEALLDNSLLTMNDFGKIARHQTLHLAFQALHGFVKKEQRLPRLRSQVGQGSRMLQPTFIHSFHKTSCLVKKEKKKKKPFPSLTARCRNPAWHGAKAERSGTAGGAG